MSRHGYYNSVGLWVEESCNAHCRGDYHATIIYVEDDPDIAAGVDEAMTFANPGLRVLQIDTAPAAPHCPAERESGLLRCPTSLYILFTRQV